MSDKDMTADDKDRNIQTFFSDFAESSDYIQSYWIKSEFGE